MAKRRLTTFSKIIITLAIVGTIVLGVRYLVLNTGLGDKLEEVTEERERELEQKAKEKEQKRLAKEEQEKLDAAAKEKQRLKEEEEAKQAELNKTQLKVMLYDNGSAVPAIYFNKGWGGNIESRFYKEFGFKVEFVVYDNFDAAMDSWAKNEFNVMIHSVDEMPSFFERWEDDEPQIFMQLDWSRGDLALISKKNIKSVNELDNKRVALRRSSACETFMHRTLEASGLSSRDVLFSGVIRKEDAFESFNTGKVQAFVVASNEPKALARQMNANLLQTTKEASHAVGRTFVVKKEFLEEKKAIIDNFYKALMTAVSEINSDRNAYESAAAIYAKNSKYTEIQVYDMMEAVRYATHEDNKNFFGLNSGYKGIKAEEIYKDMGKIYASKKLAPSSRPRWKSLLYLGAINGADSSLKGANHQAEKRKLFDGAEEAMMNKEAFASKSLIINFALGESKLSLSAKSFIDVKIKDLLQTYAHSRVRIEGNVASTGNKEADQSLSEARAKAVVSYLIEKYNYDAARFIIKGNGSSNPVKGCETMPNDACRAKNRRMEFMFLGE